MRRSGLYLIGCPADLEIVDVVSRWQHRARTARMAASGLLGGQYRHLCKHRELAEYMREGAAKSRRAMLRWRSDQIPTEVMRGRYARPQVPHARRTRHCPAGLLQKGCFGSCRASARGAADAG